MIDIRALRADPDAVKAALARRGVEAAEVDAVLEADAAWSARVSAAPDLRDALPLAQARGQLTPILGLPTQVQQIRRERTEARAFMAPAAPDSFGALLGERVLGLRARRGKSAVP